MKNGTIFAVTILAAAAILLPGCEPVTPAEGTREERPSATTEPIANPDEEMDELRKELVALPAEEPEESIAPVQVLSAQETSPPEIFIAPVTAQTPRPGETKSTIETAAHIASPKHTVEPTLVITADTSPTAMPSPTAAAPTTTPKPTGSPKATATPKPTAIPQATVAPAVTSIPKPTETPMPVSTPKPTMSPTPTPVPTATPHIHSWTMHEATGHYESQKTGTEEVAVGTYWEEIGGWDENRAAYYKCNDCGAEFFSNLDAGDHILSAYHSSYSYYPAELIHHDGEWVERTRYETRDVYEDVCVVDSEAYWSCACGVTRYSQP